MTGPRSPVGLAARIGVARDAGFRLDLDLTIEPGTTTALLGPNGAGKSTTVEAVSGLLAIDDGRIKLGSRVIDDPDTGVFVQPEDRRIGVVFQDYLLFDHLSVVDNVAFGPRSRGVGRRAATAAARAWLARLDLSDLAREYPRSLSGGQRQRVAVARALSADPEMLLLDEPLAALDVDTRSRLRRTLIEHVEQFDGPRLLITHEPADAFTMADRIHIIEDGRSSQSGTAEEIRRRPATPYVAALAGTNFLTGRSDRGRIDVSRSQAAGDETRFELTTSDPYSGPVQVVVHPTAVSLYRHRPDGSPRNTWQTVIDWIEPLGDTTRVKLGPPLPLLVDITPSAAAALDLGPGDPIWAAVKATEVSVTPS